METVVEAEPRPDSFHRVASPWHTLVVLGVLGALVFRGRLQADQMRATLNPDRIVLYKHIILFEWMTLALVLAGVWLNGSSLLTVLGNHWRSAREFFRDAGIGLLFLVASIVVTSMVGGHRGGADQATQFLLPGGESRPHSGSWSHLRRVSARKRFIADTCRSNSSRSRKMSPPASCFPRRHSVWPIPIKVLPGRR